jgi:hypothetical protein
MSAIINTIGFERDHSPVRVRNRGLAVYIYQKNGGGEKKSQPCEDSFRGRLRLMRLLFAYKLFHANKKQPHRITKVILWVVILVIAVLIALQLTAIMSGAGNIITLIRSVF